MQHLARISVRQIRGAVRICLSMQAYIYTPAPTVTIRIYEDTLQDDKIPVVSRNGWFIHGRNYSLQPSLKILVFFRNFGFNDNLIKKLKRIS